MENNDLYRTTDGGETWIRIEARRMPDFSISSRLKQDSAGKLKPRMGPNLEHLDIPDTPH